MSTVPDVDLACRPEVLNAVLDNDPSVDVLIYAFKAYRPSRMQGDCTSWECAKSDVEKLAWGERFVRAFVRITDVLIKAGLALADSIPLPAGISFYIDEQGQFCAVMFSQAPGTRYSRLESLLPGALRIVASGRFCIGFCLHSYLLHTIDPEVVAYIMVGLVGIWAGLEKIDTSKWFEDIANFDYRTPAEWAYWDVLTSGLPTSSLGEVKWLQWNQIYTPVAFIIEPGNSTMPEQYMLGDVTADQKWMRISLACLARFDMDALHGMRPFDPILVQFPTPLLNWTYHVEAKYVTFGLGRIHPVILHLKKPKRYDAAT
jgi:hypothetical protein